MGTEPTNQDVNGTQNAQVEGTKTFTEADVNRIVANRVAKYNDYDELKAKADEFDKLEEASKSELQKAQEKSRKLEQELASIKAVEKIRKAREEVAAETGVPVNLLTGQNKEECEAQAQAIKAYKEAQAAPAYPTVKDGGEPKKQSIQKSTREQFEEWMRGQTAQ